jgi:hypothetical protein
MTESKKKELLQLIVQDLGLTNGEIVAVCQYLDCNTESEVKRQEVIKICNKYLGKNYK